MKKIIWSVLAGFILAGVPHAEQIDGIYFNPSPVGKYTNLNLTERLGTQNLRVNSGVLEEPAQMDINQNATVSYSAANIQTLTLKPQGTAVVPNGTIVKLKSVSPYMPLSAVGTNTLSASGKAITVVGSNLLDSEGLPIPAMRLGNVNFPLPTKNLTWSELTDDSNHKWKVLGYDETPATPPEGRCVATVTYHQTIGSVPKGQISKYGTCTLVSGWKAAADDYEEGDTTTVSLSQEQCKNSCHFAVYDKNHTVQGGRWVMPPISAALNTFDINAWIADSEITSYELEDIVNPGAADHCEPGPTNIYTCPEPGDQTVYFNIEAGHPNQYSSQLSRLSSCKFTGLDSVTNNPTPAQWNQLKDVLSGHNEALLACLAENQKQGHGHGILETSCYVSRGAYGIKYQGTGTNTQWKKYSPFLMVLHCYEAYAPVQEVVVDLNWVTE